MNREEMMAKMKSMMSGNPKIAAMMDGKDMDKMSDQEMKDMMAKMEKQMSVKESMKRRFIEAAYLEAKGDAWQVTIIKSGKSLNNFIYNESVLQKSTPLFEGAQVFAHRTGGHIPHSEKSTLDIIGFLDKVTYQNNSLVANLNILPSAEWLRENLLAAKDKGKLNLYELSIDAGGQASATEHGIMVESIDYVDSVDVVPKGAAGGGFDKLRESLDNEDINNKQNNKGVITKMKNKLMLLFTMLYPTFLENKNVDWTKLNENELFTHLLEADKVQDRLHLPEGIKLTEALVDEKLKALLPHSVVTAPVAPIVGDKTLQDAMQKVDKLASSMILQNSLATCNLPIPMVEELRTRFSDKVFRVEELDQAIKTQKDVLAKLNENMPISTSVKMGEQEIDKAKKGFLGLLIDTSQNPLSSEERKLHLGNIPPMRSLKEAYIQITGDERITGLKKKSVKLSEAIDTPGFDQIAQDVLHTALVREYNMANLDTWRPFANIIPRGDFKTNHIYRYGGYGAPPTVAEHGAYTQLSSPTDEEATYALTKKGGTEAITLEMIRNDDVGAIRAIPRKLGRGCAYGLYYTIYYTMLRPAGAHTIYDSVTLYHASHPIKTGTTYSNTGTTAIATGLSLARMAMAKAPEKDSNIPIGIRSKYVLVPPDLEETAYNLVTSAYGVYNTVPTALQSQNIQVITVPCWTDVTDYAVVANPSDVLGLEVGFLDGNDTPELFVSDNPNSGSWFTNDEITYKIRFVWGVAVTDWRAFYGQTVAG